MVTFVVSGIASTVPLAAFPRMSQHFLRVRGTKPSTVKHLMNQYVGDATRSTIRASSAVLLHHLRARERPTLSSTTLRRRMLLISNAMSAVKKSLRVVLPFDRAQLDVVLRAPIPPAPLAHAIGALREIAVLAE